MHRGGSIHAQRMSRHGQRFLSSALKSQPLQTFKQAHVHHVNTLGKRKHPHRQAMLWKPDSWHTSSYRTELHVAVGGNQDLAPCKLTFLSREDSPV